MDILAVLIIVFGFLVGLILAYIIGHRIGAFKRDRFWEAELPNHRKNAILKSRAVLTGQFSEQLAPFLPDFEFKPTECRFIGKPVDFLVFRGLDNREIDEVVFVEVKSGGARLSNVERRLKEAVIDKRVRCEEYRVHEKLAKKDSDFEWD